MTQSFGRVVVLGTGLLGGSVGMALRAGGLAERVVGVGRRAETLEDALLLGCIDEATTDLESSVRSADLVVLATPLGTFEDLFARIAEADHEGLIVTDVGSTKVQVYRQAARLLPAPERFVGAHPMAGGDRHGPKHARADLFRDKPCVITPGNAADPAAVATVESLWSTLGMRLLKMSPEEHDRKVAVVSHLPHLLAALVVNASDAAGGLEIASTGFRDVTRVARSDPRVWLDIFRSNQRPVLEAIDTIVGHLNSFKDHLADDDTRAIMDTLRDAKSTRDGWPGPGGHPERDET